MTQNQSAVDDIGDDPFQLKTIVEFNIDQIAFELIGHCWAGREVMVWMRISNGNRICQRVEIRLRFEEFKVELNLKQFFLAVALYLSKRKIKKLFRH